MYPKVREFFAGTGRGSSLVRAFAGSAGLRAFGMALSFLVGVVLARGLGPAGYGIYGTAMSIIAVLMVPTEFGLPQMVTREVARSKLAPAREGTLYSLLRWTNRLVLVNSLLVAIGGAIVLGFISHSLDKALRDTLAWALALLPVVAIGNIYSAALRGSHRIIAGQLADLIIRPAMVCALLGGSILYGKLLSPSVAMMVNVVAAMVAAVYAVAALRPYVRESARFPRVTGARWGGVAVPMALSEGMRILAGHSAILILSFSAAPAEVGIYRVAAGIWTVATLPSTLIYVTCAPMLATLHEEGRAQAIQRLLSWMSLFLFIAAIAILAPFAIAGDWIVTMVFGSAYRDSVPIILLLLSGELISATLGHSPTVLNMFKKEKVVARYSSLGLGLNILLCMALAPRYGGFGVAAGAALGQVAWRALGSRYVRREMRLETSVLAWTTKKKGSRTCES